MLPIISGTIIMFRKCVRTGSGLSPASADFFAARSFLIRARGFLFKPRWNFLLARAWNRSTSSSVLMSSSWSKSTPLKVNLRKVLFLGASSAMLTDVTMTSKLRFRKETLVIARLKAWRLSSLGFGEAARVCRVSHLLSLSQHQAQCLQPDVIICRCNSQRISRACVGCSYAV